MAPQQLLAPAAQKNFCFGGSRPLTNLGSGPCDTAVDLAAKRDKINGLCQEYLGSAFQDLPLGIRIAIGANHDDGDVRSAIVRPVHSRHIE